MPQGKSETLRSERGDICILLYQSVLVIDPFWMVEVATLDKVFQTWTLNVRRNLTEYSSLNPSFYSYGNWSPLRWCAWFQKVNTKNTSLPISWLSSLSFPRPSPLVIELPYFQANQSNKWWPQRFSVINTSLDNVYRNDWPEPYFLSVKFMKWQHIILFSREKGVKKFSTFKFSYR